MGTGGAPGANGRPSGRWLRRLFAVGALALLLGVGGCASTGPAPIDGYRGKGAGVRGMTRVPKGYYRVRKGDSLGAIAERRRVKVDQLIRWNGLRPPYTLYVGRVLRVAPPRDSRAAAGTRRSLRRAPAATAATRRSPRRAPAATARAATPGSRAAASAVAWAWPLSGAVIQGFRPGDPARAGLRIGCRPGAEVRAAAGGEVVYSGSGLKGYGNLIIVQHNQNYLSAYGFNRRLFLTEGSRVERGQAVAECGTGPGNVPMLHFEVRRNGASVDPLLYLPPRG